MTFEEILPYIQEHKKVYRKEWEDDESYIVLSNRGARYLYLYEYDGEKLADECYTLSGYDITSNDWELYKGETPKKDNFLKKVLKKFGILK